VMKTVRDCFTSIKLPVFSHRQQRKHCYWGLFFRHIGYTRHDVAWATELMDFTCCVPSVQPHPKGWRPHEPARKAGQRALKYCKPNGVHEGTTNEWDATHCRLTYCINAMPFALTDLCQATRPYIQGAALSIQPWD
jgi:hypothetical protein